MNGSTRSSVSSSRARDTTRSPTSRIRSSRRARSTRTKLVGAGAASAARDGRGRSTPAANPPAASPALGTARTSMPSSRHASKTAPSSGDAPGNRTRCRRWCTRGATLSICADFASRPRIVSTLMPRATRSADGVNVTFQSWPRRSAATGAARMAGRRLTPSEPAGAAPRRRGRRAILRSTGHRGCRRAARR